MWRAPPEDITRRSAKWLRTSRNDEDTTEIGRIHPKAKYEPKPSGFWNRRNVVTRQELVASIFAKYEERRFVEAPRIMISLLALRMAKSTERRQ